MSLVSFALRLVASRLLRDQTWAGSRVYNSPVDPVAEWQQGAEPGQAQPCIAIYSGKRVPHIVGKATQGKSATLDLVFNIFVPPTVIIASPETNGTPAITLETSNTGGAMVIDMIERQIEAAFRFGPVAWREIWDILVVSVKAAESRPLLYEIEKTVQIPCVEVTYTLETVPDPDFGVELLPGWTKLKAAMLADPHYAASAPLLDQLICKPEGLPSWRVAQAALGMSDAAARSTGLAPVDPTEIGEPPVLAGVEFSKSTP